MTVWDTQEVAQGILSPLHDAVEWLGAVAHLSHTWDWWKSVVFLDFVKGQQKRATRRSCFEPMDEHKMGVAMRISEECQLSF